MARFEQNRPTTRSRTVLRFAFDLILLFTVFLAPWWLTLTLSLLIIAWLKGYEALFFGLLLDGMYAGGNTSFNLGDYTYTSILLVFITLTWLTTPYIRAMER